jgi:subtilisin family serine protease
MFFSSGNENGTTGPIWPASMAQTIAVNATSMCDERKSPSDCSSESWGGDHGPGLDFSAPGVKISTTDMTGNKGFTITNYYYSFNGTSAACPNAAGVGALLLSIRPDLTAEDVRNVIAQTAEKVGGYNYSSSNANGTWCNELGNGRVNAYKALQLSFSYSSVNEQSEENTLKVFPNPANDVLYVHSDYVNSEWKLLSVTGAEMLKGNLVKGISRIDAGAMPAGVYLLTVNTGKGWATSKVSITQ